MRFEPGFRVFVSGSRTWLAPQLIWEDLEEALKEATGLGKRMILIHGWCRRGADAHADQWGNQPESGRRNGGVVIVERHPADWEMHKKKAGFIRNQTMVGSGIDLALFYIHNDSPGTTHALGLARAAGLRRRVVRRWGADWHAPHIPVEERPIPGLEGL